MDCMVKESWKIFKSMKKDWNVNLTADHYSCMIDIIGRAGMLIEAYELDLDSRMCVLHSNIYAAKDRPGGLKNLADDVGGSKRRSISEPDSMLRCEWALRIGRTSTAMGKYVFPS
nr:pentatricopeptide repeat-containing protein At4g02750-like [Tanacetum cinerariifolium]